jgi:hypothetical protein
MGQGESARVQQYNLLVSRFYQAAEANRLLPELSTVVTRLRDERTEIVGLRDAYLERRGRPADDPREADADSIGDDNDDPELRRIRLRIRGIVDQMQADVAWLDERGIVLRDIASGLLDFPALVEGRQIWLCWHLGEERVGWWHDTSDGYAGRQPLDTLPEATRGR